MKPPRTLLAGSLVLAALALSAPSTQASAPEDGPFWEQPTTVLPAVPVGNVEFLVCSQGEMLAAFPSESIVLSPELFYLPALPFEAGFLFQDTTIGPDDWYLYYLGSTTLMHWDATRGMHVGFFAGFDLFLYNAFPRAEGIQASAPRRSLARPGASHRTTIQGPGDWILLACGAVNCFPTVTGGNPGYTFEFRSAPFSEHTVHFEQFITITIKWTATMPDGSTIDGAAQGGRPLRGSSNGGHEVEVDGSTTYVDSVDPSNPHYDSGGAGEICPDGGHMQDFPGVVRPDGLAAALNLVPAGAVSCTIDMLFEFTTYVIVDGEVVYRWDWTDEQIFTVPTGGAPIPGPTPGGPQPIPGEPHGAPLGCPASGMDANHQLADQRYRNGDYSGAPR